MCNNFKTVVFQPQVDRSPIAASASSAQKLLQLLANKQNQEKATFTVLFCFVLTYDINLFKINITFQTVKENVSVQKSPEQPKDLECEEVKFLSSHPFF